jgi:hypothetical protein
MGSAVTITATGLDLKFQTCMPILTLFRSLKHLNTDVVQIHDIKERNTDVQYEKL